MMKIREVEIINNNRSQIIINKKDICINGGLLSDQLGVSLYGFLKLEYIKESIEHIKSLTGTKEKYESLWDKNKGMYIHPFIASEMLAIKKLEEQSYIKYYNLLKRVMAEDNQYEWIEIFHNLEDKSCQN